MKMVVFDIDGVLTDGCVYVDESGHEFKSFRLTEIDALNEIKKAGYRIAAITGESTPIVEVFEKRISWDYFYKGCKDKLKVLKEISDKCGINREDICYIGDGKYDIPAIEYAGLGVCPRNAIPEAKAVADTALNGAGGQSCIRELYTLLNKIDGCERRFEDRQTNEHSE